MEPPPGVLAAGEARVQRRAFIKAPTVLVEEIGLDADRAVLASHSVGRSVVVGSYHDERIYMRVVGAQGAIEEVIKTNAGGDDLDPQCALPTLVINQPLAVKRVDAVLNNSFGMLGINSALIVKRYSA